MNLVGVVILVGGLLSDGGLISDGQNSPRVAMLEQAGWEAVDANRLPLATAIFKEAMSLDPKNAALRYGAGIAALLQRHDAEARQHFQQALVLDPKLTRARVQLAQVARRQGSFDEAIKLLEAAAVELPGDAGVRELLDRWLRERELHERMRLTVGDFFTVSFEGPEDAQLAAQALESLNRS